MRAGDELCKRCGKVRYETRGDATHAVNLGRRTGKILHAYYDPGCRYWHLSSRRDRKTHGRKPKKQDKRRRGRRA